MKPFIIGDKRFAFDVTNADDLRRLERAFEMLCLQQKSIIFSCSSASLKRVALLSCPKGGKSVDLRISC